MLTVMDHIPIGQQPANEPGNVVPLHAPESEADEPVMSYEEAMASDEGEGGEGEDGTSTSAAPGAGVAAMLEQGIRVGSGMFSAGASAFADAIRATMAEPSDQEKDPLATLAGAGLGAAVTAAEAAAAAAGSAAEAVAPFISWAVNPRFAKDATEVASGAARVLDGQWKTAQAETVQAASAFLAVLVPEIAGALFDQVDLTALVRERVDLNAIVDDVDIARILERVDVDQVVAKVDVDGIVDRVDIDRVTERVDLPAIIERLDLTAIALEVVDDIDLPTIVRESSGALASEGVQTVRVQGMNADRLVSRVVDKVLRREARDLEPPAGGD